MSDARRVPQSPLERRQLALRAATLFERLASTAPVALEPTSEARQLLEQWQRAYSPGSWSAFSARLGWDGLTTDAVLQKLSTEPTETGTASWMSWVDAFCAESRVHADGPAADDPFAPDAADRPPFVEVLLPAHAVALRGLQARVEPAARAAFAPSALDALGRRLLQDLAAQSELALFARFTAHGAYRSFVTAMLEGDIDMFLEQHPVLARHFGLIIDTWIRSSAEVISRLADDRDDLKACFNDGRDPGDVVGLEPALSDPHHGRRRVMRLEFASGLRVIYKPRDIGIEHAFANFLTTLERIGLAPAPRAINTLPREGYGWVENITGTPLADAAAANDWFGRAGALLCIAHVLRGRDLHMDNVIATGDGPVLIDVELLLQPVRATDVQTRGTVDVERASHRDSCLGTGLVSDLQTSADGTLFDVGGLRGDGRGRLPVARREWRELSSDALHSVQTSTYAVRPSNRPTLDGQPLKLEAFTAPFLDGFARAYRFLMAHREALAGPGGALDVFENRWTRVIGRPTDQYAALLAVLAAPRYQQSGAHRSTAVDALNRAFSLSASRPTLWPLTADERRSLEGLDIPLFQAATDARHVFCEGRQVLANHFAQSGLHAVRERLAALSDAELGQELLTLRRTMEETVDTRFTTAPTVSNQPATPPTLGTRVVAHALWIAEESLVMARPGAAGAEAASFFLYDGELGPALFHAAVAATTGSEVSAIAARDIVQRLSTIDLSDAERRPLGVCSGDGSLIYGLTMIGHLLEDTAITELAGRVASGITASRVQQDEQFDVTGGAAGAILGLLALHARTGDRRLLDRAVLCGERLLATRVAVGDGAAWRARDGRLYVGLAHGAAGIGLALVRLARATGRQEFLLAAAAAHKFERRAYLPDQRNWPIASPEEGAGVEVMTAWCHGAPGLALARTLAAVTLRDRALLNGVETALRTTAAVPVRLDDHVCCGSMGRCDVLLTTGLALGADQAVNAAWKLAGEVIDRAERERRYRLTSRGHQMRVFDTGFFRGLSGIGYQLLRLAAPSRVPSILAFEPPSQRPRSSS